MYERIGKYTTDVIQGGPTFKMPFDTAPRGEVLFPPEQGLKHKCGIRIYDFGFASSAFSPSLLVGSANQSIRSS